MKIQILKSTNGQFYWRIVARNNRILATSETYKSKQSAIKSAFLLREEAPVVEDLTK